MTNTSLKLPDLKKILIQLDVGLGMLIMKEAYEPLRQAVLSAPDTNAPELRHWLADNFVAAEFTSAVQREYAAKAWIANVLAEQAEKKGDSAAAWYHVSEARFHEGQMVADFDAMERIDRIRAAGRKGGQNTGVKRSSLMRECIHLLTERRPADGWESHEHACNNISAELIDFTTRDGEALTRDDILLKVMEWLAKHSDVRAAYQGESGQT